MSVEFPASPGDIQRTRRRSRWRRFLRWVIVPGIAGVLLTLRPGVGPREDPLPMPYPYIPSPNYDDRPEGVTVNCVVLHATVEPTVQGTINIFLDPAKRVSAHFIVGKEGQVIQMVPVEKRAWHAGPSELDGKPAVNDYSVGIEMVNRNDGVDPYPEVQMQAVAGIIRFVRSRYVIPDERIVSHATVARPAGRKTDPRNFDLDRLRRLARIP
ncbi:MAG: N-acetylmuramoyl-L-alanine amidase [Chloroherpetonaceae bacterium]|nr:N-acetylmuramoyl-L-alanine amidase [Chthonomonadaceae bacterium]MDW8206572.1 N-acetylmuramoyl-L-alanine amidase [Chloroherpetonaceae bacterium]